MMRLVVAQIALLTLLVCPIFSAETIVLKTGDTIDGVIMRTVGSNVTIRTSTGIGTYHVNELDQAWVDEHYDKIFTEVRQKRADEVKRMAALFKGLVGKDSLSKATPFLTAYRKYVLTVSAGLIAIGLALCFFGWKLFKFKRRFAMLGARSRALGGLRFGGLASIFSLPRFAFFDLSVIWGHALSGSVLIVIGVYCAAVPLLALTDDHLQAALMASVGISVLLCIFGAASQIKTLRSDPTTGYRGDY